MNYSWWCLEEPYVKTESGSAACKVNSLPTVLLLSPLDSRLQNLYKEEENIFSRKKTLKCLNRFGNFQFLEFKGFLSFCLKYSFLLFFTSRMISALEVICKQDSEVDFSNVFTQSSKDLAVVNHSSS